MENTSTNFKLCEKIFCYVNLKYLLLNLKIMAFGEKDGHCHYFINMQTLLHV